MTNLETTKANVKNNECHSFLTDDLYDPVGEERGEAFFDYVYAERAKAERGEPAMVKVVGNVMYLLTPKWKPQEETSVAMTFFPNQYAKSMSVEKLSLQELANRVISTTKSEKGKLPFVKLATFTGEINPNHPEAGCLRCDETVYQITGVEGDKDNAPLGFDEAGDKLEAAGLPALLYTSASHTEENPRFRVLCPTSRPLPPTERGKLIERLNGVLGGALSRESFALSQSYYFGNVKGTPTPRIRIIHGDRCIDQRNDLDAIAIGKGQSAKTKGDDYHDAWEKLADELKGPIDVDQMLADMECGHPEHNVHNTQLRVIAALLKRGVEKEEAIATVLERTMDVTAIPSEKTRATQTKILQGMADSWLRKNPDLVETVPLDQANPEKPPAKPEKVAPLIIMLAEKLWGQASMVSKHQYCFNNNQVVVDTVKSVWFDFENNKGGNLKDLMDTVKGKPSKDAHIKEKLLQSTAEFLEGYVPPDYLIDGLLQRRYVYSLTAPTGSGKTAIALCIAIHVAFGLMLAGREVEKGRVLFFAGENPDDVRSRWIKVCEEMGYDWEQVDVTFMPFTLDLEEWRKQIDAECAEHGPFSLLIVDTSAAYYTGDEENDNVQLGNHARMLRTFVKLPGGPTVLVTCHPTKNPNPENLLPRGGGAFLAEVDGNLVCLKDAGSTVVEVTTHGKFRGPDFKPFAFKLVPGQSDMLVDSKGRNIWTITAQPISDSEQEQIEQVGDSARNELLCTMLDCPGLSTMELAKKLGWTTVHGEPNKFQVYRMLKDLVKAKLVEQDVNEALRAHSEGREAAQDLPLVTPNVVVTSPPKPKAQPNIVAVVAAWKAHFPSTIGVTVDELMAAGEEILLYMRPCSRSPR